MKQCDICYNKVDELETLRPEYQNWKLKEVCKECLSELNNAVLAYDRFWDSAKKANSNKWYNRLINNLRHK